VNTAVNQMDQVTQQNAAMVEEATAAAANLRAESQELTRLIGRFQTGAATARSTRPELVAKASHRPAPSPVARQHAKLAAAVGAEAEWSEF